VFNLNIYIILKVVRVHLSKYSRLKPTKEPIRRKARRIGASRVKRRDPTYSIHIGLVFGSGLIEGS